MLKISNNDARRLTQKDNSKSREERLKELDKSSSVDDQITIRPASQVDRSKMISNSISDQSVKDRIAKTLEDPNAVVINATIR